MKYLSIVLSLALIILVTAPVTSFTVGDSQEETPQLLLLTLNSPANNSIITQFNCDFTFTPTLLGSDKFYSANLVITSGNDVIGGFSQYYKTNQTAIVNATHNTISYTFNQNGTYAWNVRIYNSTHSIVAAKTSSDGTEQPVSYILQVAVYEPDPTPQPTPTPNPTSSPTPSPTPTTTPDPTLSPTVPPTVAPSPTATPSPSPSPSSSQTPNPTTTANPSPSPSSTVNPSTTPTLTPTLTPSPNPTQNPTAVPTNNLTPTIRPSPTPTKTLSPNNTLTPTPTTLPSESQTPQPTQKPQSPEQTLLTAIIVFVLVDALLLLGFRHYLVRPKNEF